MNTLLLIDGNAIMHRAFHALPSFKTKSGIPTNVIYGFFSMLHKTINDFHPTHIIVCFDTPKPTFRNKLFKEYQSHRPKIDDDFITQIPLLKVALEKSGILSIEKDGYEADDLIGTIAKKGEKAKMKVLILTGDRDILQLVNKHTFVIAPLIGLNIKLYDEVETKNRMQVSPADIPDLKALMGDPSDNYPGAKGIGPKTAAHLIEQFQTIDNLLSNLAKVENEKTKKIIENEKPNILLSKKLATIVCDVPIEINLDKTQFIWFKNDLQEYFAELEIRTLSKRIFENKKQESKPPKKTVKEQDKNQMGLF